MARLAALEIKLDGEGPVLWGDLWGEPHKISWPGVTVTGKDGEMAPLQTEALWLHYLDRADGQPLSGRWVNLSEIGGRFYQQAFQGYTGNMLARAWNGEYGRLKLHCRAQGGWEIEGISDLAFQWRALPRLPVCFCYRRPSGASPAWATILFDAATSHYVAADVAAGVGSQLARRLMPPVS